MRPRIVAAAGHLAREAALWGRYVADRVRGRRQVIVFLQGFDAAGVLRAEAVGRAMGAEGWASIVVPPQLGRAQRDRILRATRPDVVVLQQCRHALNDPSLIPVPTYLVLDLDDADWLDPVQLPRLERAVSDVDLVIAGSRNVARWARSRHADVEVIWTTGDAPAHLLARQCAHPVPILAWATPELVQLPHEQAFLARVLAEVAARASYELWIFGVSSPAALDDDLRSLTRAGVTLRCIPRLPYAAFLGELARADIGLNPLCEDLNPYASGKSFGKVLAYLSAGLAVVTTRGVDHLLFFRDGDNGVLCDGVAEWTDRLTQLVLDPAACERIGRAGRRDYERRLTPPVAAHLLTEALAARGHAPGHPAAVMST